MNNDFTNMEVLMDLLDPQIALYMALAVSILFMGKLINDWTTPYSLNKQLTEVDNKAIAVSFSGYLFAIGVIVYGVLSGTSPESDSVSALLSDAGACLLWGFIGIILLQLSRVINDKALLYKFSNIKELVEDKNVGTGAVQLGSYIGSAFIIKGALTGDENDALLMAILSTLIYFVIGQFIFVIFGTLYQRITKFDLHDEIEKDNMAVGTAYGLNLVAIGILIGSFIGKYDSIPALGLWFVISAFLLITCRFMVDKLILPTAVLDDEVSRDRNWGAALIEGGAALSLALILTSLF